MAVQLLAATFIAVLCVLSHSLTDDEIAVCLSSHNDLRDLHTDTPTMVWDAGLAAAAQEYADELVKINSGRSDVVLDHESPANGMGENLYWRDNKEVGKCAHAALSWYDEISDYDYETASSVNGAVIGHFTQLVWKESTKLGMGIATMTSRRYADYGNTETFIVAKYQPRGNSYTVGQKYEDYTDNVAPRKEGAVTPTVEQLDPSLVPACEDESAHCDWFLGAGGYTCDGAFGAYFKDNCYQSCGYC